jgi:hypothetical protein
MAFCPYLTYFVPLHDFQNNTREIPNINIQGNLYNNSNQIIGQHRPHSQSISGEYLGSMAHVNCIEVECQLWDQRHNRCGLKVTDYNQGDGDGIITCSDEQCSGIGIPTSAQLLSEYYGNQDLDDNGLVCGVDFYITDDIPMLQGVPKNGTPMTMGEYRNTLID